MKSFKAFFALLFLIGTFHLNAQSGQGWITISQSPTATAANYDVAVEKLKAAGIWEMSWTFHAMGAAQPMGLFGIGIFADKASLDARVAKVDEVFKANNIKVPTPEAFEIYSLAPIPFPAVKPAQAIMIHHNVPGMTAAQYDNIVAELKKANAFGNPAQLFHVCYKTPTGLQVVDIWKSPEALQNFAGVLVPILTKIFGAAPAQPAVYGLYNVVRK